MRRKVAFLLIALAVLTSGCDRFERFASAPVTNLGLRGEEGAGAMTVESGDTLWNIAQRYRLPIRGIIELNGLEPPYPLAQGRRLKLPAPLEYRVRHGDTLYSIANMFETGVHQLVKVNRLPEPYRISAGQNLRIPSPYAVQAAATTKAKPAPRPAKGGAAPAVERQPLVESQPAEKPAMRKRLVLAEVPPPKFIWPVRGKVISSYGAKSGGLYNDGINIAAPRGTSVQAAASGTVVYVGDDLQSYGNLVLVRHAGGTTTAYAHLAAVKVRKGSSVRQGQMIGTVGSSGTVAGTQLHFEIRRGAKTYDPQRYL